MTEAAEREHDAQEDSKAFFDVLCPGIRNNPLIPHWPTPQQFRFLSLHLSEDKGDPDEVFEALYGGAAGGGKSDALLMAAAQYAMFAPTYAAAMFRRTYADLSKPGALIPRALEWWLSAGAVWNGTDKKFTLPNRSTIQMAHMSLPNAHLEHQSAEYNQTFWDELTHHPNSSQYKYVALSRVRRLKDSKIPLRALSASNPGGPGHVWVMHRFVEGESEGPPELPGRFVPARIADNPYIDGDAYIRGMQGLHPTVRDQLIAGDWRARDPGDYFRREWFGPLLDPDTDTWPDADCVRIRWWDLAASVKPDASKTAGVRMVRHRSGVRAVEHCASFRATPGTRDDKIIQVAQADGRRVTVGIEIEGGSGGLAQFLQLEQRLKSMGYRAVGARPRVDLSDRQEDLMVRNPGSDQAKAGRADPVASCLERGYQRRGECVDTGGPWWGLDRDRSVTGEQDGIRLFAGSWTHSYLDAIEGFPPDTGKEGVDEVDATSAAWAWLEAHPLSGGLPRFHKRPAADLSEQHDVHPELRRQPEDMGKDRAGRWKP